MSLFKSVDLQRVTRQGSFLNGRYTDADDVVTDFKGTFQPATGEDIQSLPEGRRSSQTFKVYGDIELKTADQYANSQADRVRKDGIDYEVVTAFPWQNSVLNHYKALVQRVKE